MSYGCSGKDCSFRTTDIREAQIHALKAHNEVLEPCHAPGCEGALFKSISNHWVEIHVGEKLCELCKPWKTLKNCHALYNHVKACHQGETGLVEARKITNIRPHATLEDFIGQFFDFGDLHLIKNGDRHGVLFDRQNERAVCGVEVLYNEDTKTKIKFARPEFFCTDLNLPTNQTTATAIRYQGYHVGHIIPAQNWSHDKNALDATFNNSNITANNGIWRSIEDQCVSVATCSDVTVIFTLLVYGEVGPIQSCGNVNVNVAKSFINLMYMDKGNGKWMAQIFYAENNGVGHGFRLWRQRLTFAELKKQTGFTFKVFPLSWDQQVRIFRCKEVNCIKAFYELTQLEDHREEHRKQIRCCRCNKSFTSVGNLKEHQNECFIQCVFCGARVRGLRDIDEHIRRHINEKPFTCDNDGCDKAFPAKSHLAKHKLSHGPPQFKCTTCDKRYTTRSQLNRHRWIHLDVKRYGCSKCAQTSAQKESINRHIKRVHGGHGHVTESEEWFRRAAALKRQDELDLYENRDDDQSSPLSTSTTITSFEDDDDFLTERERKKKLNKRIKRH